MIPAPLVPDTPTEIWQRRNVREPSALSSDKRAKLAARRSVGIVSGPGGEHGEYPVESRALMAIDCLLPEGEMLSGIQVRAPGSQPTHAFSS